MKKTANPSFNDPDVFLQSVNLTKLVHSVSDIWCEFWKSQVFDGFLSDWLSYRTKCTCSKENGQILLLGIRTHEAAFADKNKPSVKCDVVENNNHWPAGSPSEDTSYYLFLCRVKLKEGITFLGARPSNPTQWIVSQDVRSEGHRVVTLHCRRKESSYDLQRSVD